LVTPTLRLAFDVGVFSTNCSYISTVSAVSVLLTYKNGLTNAAVVNFITGLSIDKIRITNAISQR